MKKIHLTLLALCLLCVEFALASDFKVVGYLPSYRKTAAIDYDKLTHLCIAFANPTNQEGDMSHTFGSSLKTIVDKAHEKDVKVLMSIGGGAASSSLEENYIHLMKSENRVAFITKLLDFLEETNVDGLDLDLEGDLVSAKDYNDFVVTIADSVKKRNAEWEITAAFAAWNANNVSDEAVESLDFINSMTYDVCGPTWGQKGCNHSTFEKAESDYDYWVKERKIGEDRFIVGVPFYGINWETSEYVTYQQVVDEYPEDLEEDETSDGKILYNGKKTIRKKVDLALTKGGGIMIWEIGQDAIGSEHSMLDVIHESILLDIPEYEELAVEVFPTEVNEELFIKLDNNLKQSELLIVDIIGKVLYKGQVSQNTTINTSSWEKGLYIVHLTSDRMHYTQKVRVK
ncbi:MAG: T9SS type A sorting domain-containing protein [Cytophagales bacterium]|nr:T9SS type A sorting domain-containing protein [Cytophagales bacterium]